MDRKNKKYRGLEVLEKEIERVTEEKEETEKNEKEEKKKLLM